MNKPEDAPPARELFRLAGKYPVARPESDDLRTKSFRLFILEIAVAEYDDFVSDHAFSGCRSVKAYLPRVLLAWNYVCFEALPVVEVADHHLFEGENAGLFHYGFVYGDAALIRQIGLGYGRHMYLGPEDTP